MSSQPTRASRRSRSTPRVSTSSPFAMCPTHRTPFPSISTWTCSRAGVRVSPTLSRSRAKQRSSSRARQQVRASMATSLPWATRPPWSRLLTWLVQLSQTAPPRPTHSRPATTCRQSWRPRCRRVPLVRSRHAVHHLHVLLRRHPLRRRHKLAMSRRAVALTLCRSSMVPTRPGARLCDSLRTLRRRCDMSSPSKVRSRVTWGP